ncbi:MAG: PH domain-containing protein [Candidatus Aminicenantes bacterium]|nr:PH domain-containing protein [Candidatus Aminicenantes bacterium]
MEFILPGLKLLTYFGIGTIVLGILLLLGIIWGRQGPLSYILGSIICVAVGIFLLSIKTSGKIVLNEDTISLHSPLNKSFVIHPDSVPKAWVEDLQDSEWKPVRKKSGTAAGDIRSGWFTLKNGKKAYIALQGWKALCLETEDGHIALFGTADFDLLLSEVRKRYPNLSQLF